jgi:hypothetical protein
MNSQRRPLIWKSLGTGAVLGAAIAVASAQEAPPVPADAGVLGEAEPLLLTEYRVDVVREGPAYQATAELVLRNPRATPVEGVALVPVPDPSIARGFLVANGDVRMKGVVRSRDRAVDVYRGITRARPSGGRDPAVLERLGPSWMRATIAPIAASGQVRLSIGYLGFTEKLGDRRSVELPSERTAFRGTFAGSSRRLLPGELTTGPLTTWCFRAPGADGSFCLELDPSELLARPLERATYLLVLETPESTSDEFAEAGGATLAELVAGLGPDDSVELWSNGAETGFLGGPTAADATTRERLDGALRHVDPGGWGHLDQRVNAALRLAAAIPGDVRVVVASAQRRVGRLAELQEEVARASAKLGARFGLFTCALGTRADSAALAALARAGRGRAFSVLAAEETALVAPPLAAAARRPVLFLPRASVSGATELLVEAKRHVTFGETLRVSGRYAEGMRALVRLEGHVGDGFVDAMWETTLDDENVAHPWVATMWAGLRATELGAQAPGEEALAYLVRLAERFSLIGPTTVSLGLEPALEDRLPPLMGTPTTPVAKLDPPERPTPPSRPEVPDQDRERRPPPLAPVGPVGPNGPTGTPLSRPPPSAPPASPNIPGPSGPPATVPTGHAASRGGGH